MFALIYKFPFPKNKLREYLKIDKQAEKIYRHYGLKQAINTPYLVRRLNKNTIEICLICFYKSKKEYKEKIKKIDKDRRLIALYNKVIENVSERKIQEIEYETFILKG